jgi:hypothetical protein
MSKSSRSGNQSGGVNIQGSQVSIGGDLVGRDKIKNQGMSGEEALALAKEFNGIRQMIEQRPPDADVDKQELQELVGKIEGEVQKGDQANPAKVERWLGYLANMADDIFQLTAAVLSSPAAGVVKAVQLIAKKARETSGITR